MTNEDHNKYLSYSFFAHAGIQSLWMIIIAAMMFGSRNTTPVVYFVYLLMMGLQLLMAVPSAIAGYGLLKKKSWARTWSVIGAITAAINIPVGTAICIYALWFFFGERWKDVYDNVGYPESEPAGLPSAADFKRWEAEAAAYEQNREKTPVQGDWR